MKIFLKHRGTFSKFEATFSKMRKIFPSCGKFFPKLLFQNLRDFFFFLKKGVVFQEKR